MKARVTVLLLFVCFAACSTLGAEDEKNKSRPNFPEHARVKGLPPGLQNPSPLPSPTRGGKAGSRAVLSRKASTEEALSIGQFRELIAKAKATPVDSLAPGGATRAPTATAVQKMAKKANFDRARETKHEIGGKDQTLTPASLQHLRSLADLRSGTHVLGRFHTESASKELTKGDYTLVLVCEAGYRNIYAVRTDGTAVHQAKYVQVRHLGGQDKVPANEVHQGSFIFMMYYAIPYFPMSYPYFPTSYPSFPMSYPYYPMFYPYYGMSFEVVQILFYFP